MGFNSSWVPKNKSSSLQAQVETEPSKQVKEFLTQGCQPQREEPTDDLANLSRNGMKMKKQMDSETKVGRVPFALPSLLNFIPVNANAQFSSDKAVSS